MTTTAGNAPTTLGSPSRKGIARYLAGGLAILFGLATLVEGGNVLFGGVDACTEAGNVVPFVLTFNFLAGFLYVATGSLTILHKPIAVWLARGLAVATVLVFIGLGVHILAGGAFENRTAVAMTIRSVFWSVQALALPALLARGKAQP